MKLFGFLQGNELDKPLGGRYRLIDQLGEGGFGQTFLAEDLHLPGNPRCVVKRLKLQVNDSKSLEVAVRLFNTEAQVLYQLGTHDQIPRLLAHFEAGQNFYLVQELVHGQPLTTELVQGVSWTEPQVIRLLREILEVLVFVHSQNVIHRDIKPANLMRRSDGRIVMIDFGAVKQVSTQLMHSESGPTHTIAIGTQGYMPNEQLAGNPRFSSDVYAVGMIGIQALTGRPPRHLGQDPQTSEILWHDQAPQVSSELAQILDRMVCYDFRSRYPTAAEALNALQQLGAETGSASGTATSAAESAGGTLSFTESLGETLEAPPHPSLSSLSQQPTLTVNSPGVSSGKAAIAPKVATLPGSGVSNPGTTALAELHSQTLQLAHSTLTTLRSQPRKTLATAASIAAVAGLVVWLQPDRSAQTATSIAPAKPPTVSPSPAATPDRAAQFSALLSRATQQREARQYKRSLNFYQQAVRLDAKSPEAHWGKCYNLNFLNQPGAAIAACDAALKLRPDYPEALWSKGYALEQQQKYTQALPLYERAIALKSNFAEAWNNKGTTLLLLNRPDEALVALDKAINLKPKLAEAWNNRGAALWSLRRFDDATASIDRAIALQPDYKAALSLRQQIRERLGR